MVVMYQINNKTNKLHQHNNNHNQQQLRDKDLKTVSESTKCWIK
jgi:hypothetical protein